MGGSLFERKEREKFGYMSSPPVTVGNCRFHGHPGSVCLFPFDSY